MCACLRGAALPLDRLHERSVGCGCFPLPRMSQVPDASFNRRLRALAWVAAGLALVYLVYQARTGGEISFPSRTPGFGTTRPVIWTEQPVGFALCFFPLAGLFWVVMLILSMFFEIVGSALAGIGRAVQRRWIRWAQWKPWRKWWWWPGK